MNGIVQLDFFLEHVQEPFRIPDALLVAIIESTIASIVRIGDRFCLRDLCTRLSKQDIGVVRAEEGYGRFGRGGLLVLQVLQAYS
jgi:hypothetical protein